MDADDNEPDFDGYFEDDAFESRPLEHSIDWITVSVSDPIADVLEFMYSQASPNPLSQFERIMIRNRFSPETFE